MNGIAFQLFLILNLATAVFAVACPFPETLAIEKAGPAKPLSAVSIADYESKISALFEIESRSLYKRFREGSLTEAMFAECQGQSPRFLLRLKQQFPQYFLTEAALDLQSSPRPAVAEFGRAAMAHLESGALYPIRLEWDSEIDPSRPAGYDRETRGLFFQLGAIEPRAWPLYFIHEYSHAFDNKIRQAVRDYSDPNVEKPAIAIVQRNPEALSPEELEILIRYLRAGADRGLFAEYRAWVVSTWLNGSADADLPALKKQWWEKLRVSFTLPDEGLFKHRLVRQAYEVMLSRVDPLTEDFGDLEQYLKR